MRAALFVVASLMGACTHGTDVIARADDAGVGNAKDDGAGDPAPAPKPKACGPTPASFYVLTKAGDIHTFDVATKKAVTKGVPDCLKPGQSAMAVDRSGTIWISSSGLIAAVDALTSKCTRVVKMPAAPLAMAFRFDPKTGEETLYSADAAGLSIVDTTGELASLKFVAKIAASDTVRSLSATADGWLLAFTGDAVITISVVSTDTGETKPLAVAKSPEPFALPLAGGFPTGAGYEIVLGPNAYAMALSVPTPTFEASLFAKDPGILAVATSPCAPLGK